MARSPAANRPAAAPGPPRPLASDRVSPVDGDDRRMVVAAATINLVTRLVTVAAIAISAPRRGRSIGQAVTRWDGAFYAQIAAQGYPHHLPMNGRAVAESPAAFFPLFPVVTRPFTAIGLPFWVAALLVVTVCSAGAAALIALVVARYTDRRVALLTACCFSVYPLAGVLSLAYSEALLAVLAAGCLLALLRRRWLVAGVLAMLAGATRPTGAVLIVACLVAAADAVYRRRDWSSLVAVALSPLGLLASWAWIGTTAGRWDAWFATEQDGWGSHFDAGTDTVRTVFHELTGTAHHSFGPEQAVFVLAALALVLVAAWRRPPVPVLAFMVGLFVLVAGTSNTHAALPRYLLVAFPLLVPIATWLRHRPWPFTGVLLGAAGVVSAGLGAYFAVFSSIAP